MSNSREADRANKSPPFHLDDNQILTDSSGNQWRHGKSIGYGGFGETYSFMSDDITKRVTPANAKYVIKLEPHSNGSLLIEKICYTRVSKAESINSWVAKNNLSALGIPEFVGSGSHMFDGQKYRFLIMPKFGKDLEKIFCEEGMKLHIKTVFTIASYVIDALEYLHKHNYVHTDIKPENLVLGLESQAPIYLLDFGLACRFRDSNGDHKPFLPNDRRAHNGTIAYTSRDAHVGAMSRRGDLEILGYNLIYLLTGHLPWEDERDVDEIAEQKRNAIDNIADFLTDVFESDSPPQCLYNFLEYVKGLGFETEPDYSFCKKLFKRGIQMAGFVDDGKLTFEDHAKLNIKKQPPLLHPYKSSEAKLFHHLQHQQALNQHCNHIALAKLNEQKKNVRKNIPPVPVPSAKKAKLSPSFAAAPDHQNLPLRRSTRLNPASMQVKVDWQSIIASDPERRARKLTQLSKALMINRPDPALLNPTPAMQQVIAKRIEKLKEKRGKRKQGKKK
ncbi:serine/threonine-protein kinase VRK1-like [Nilaparvata lugens]|uniref:serine/threonine-protein kinase VRK1-like n=1 Tax=Nilaparvata lugens TaxID=108931 RepID=UPI00193C9E79|nr:serine/threonine-protein kinase VRK1-like [Nilaparvata lugens]